MLNARGAAVDGPRPRGCTARADWCRSLLGNIRNAIAHRGGYADSSEQLTRRCSIR